MIWRLIKEAFSPVTPPQWAPYEPVEELSDEATRSILKRDGLSLGRDEDMAFLRAALGDNRHAKGIDLRRHGTSVSAARLRQLKLRSNTILTEDFLAILTDKGLINPVMAAQTIVSAYLDQVAGTNAIGRTKHAGITMVEVIANTMAAGPCSACLKLAEKPIPIEQAPTGPLPECPRPSQCRLFTRAALVFD